MNKKNTNKNQKNKNSIPKGEVLGFGLAGAIINFSSDAIITTNLNGDITLWIVVLLKFTDILVKKL